MLLTFDLSYVSVTCPLKWPTRTKAGGAERDTNGVCFTFEVTEYFIHQLSEAD
jgi:hypothetical protein